MNLERMKHWSMADVQASYGIRETMLYALGVGACLDPLDPRELRFVFEQDLQALPTMACVLAHPGAWLRAPELAVSFHKLVHAEQHFELAQPLPAEGRLIGSYRVTGIVDKGAQSGAMLYFRKTLRTMDGAAVGTVDSTYFLRGDGGCGSWGEAGRELKTVPETPPSGVIDIPLLPIAGLIYRLSGDYNPLHADPEFARKAGFDKPILHGLCTYGVACQALVRLACGMDATRLRSMGARFTRPVFPGETLRTECWARNMDGGGGTLRFRCLSVERNEVVLDRGVATLF